MAFSRKKIIVKPSYQIKLALNVFIYIIIFSIILGFIIFYPLYHDLNAAKDIEEQAHISSMVLYLHKRFWIGLLFVAVLAGAHAIISSHRVVGPMYRFERMVRDLTGGSYGVRIRIRKKDEFKEMEVLLNELAATLERKSALGAELEKDLKTRLETASALMEAEGSHCPEDIKRLMNSVISDLGSRRV